MERKISIILNDEEKAILRQAAEIMQDACSLAKNQCVECPFITACESFPYGENITSVASVLEKI